MLSSNEKKNFAIRDFDVSRCTVDQSTDLGDSGPAEDDAAKSSECPESGDVRRWR